MASSLFLKARSISSASLIASAESPVCGVFTFGATVRVAAALSRATAAGRRAVFAAALGDDINFVSLLQHLVFLQLHLPVRDALAGLHVVFHAVPRADEIHVLLGEVQALRGLVGAQPLLDLGDGQSFAGGAALVQAEIAVGVILAFVPEHADLVVADEHDTAVAVGE